MHNNEETGFRISLFFYFSYFIRKKFLNITISFLIGVHMTYQDIYGAKNLILFVAAVSFLVTFVGTWKKEKLIFSALMSLLVAPATVLIVMCMTVLYNSFQANGFSIELLLAIPTSMVFLVMGLHIFLFYIVLGLLTGVSSGFLAGVALLVVQRKCCKEGKYK